MFLHTQRHTQSSYYPLIKTHVEGVRSKLLFFKNSSFIYTVFRLISFFPGSCCLVFPSVCHAALKCRRSITGKEAFLFFSFFFCQSYGEGHAVTILKTLAAGASKDTQPSSLIETKIFTLIPWTLFRVDF